MIGIIGAMEVEIEGIRSMMTDKNEKIYDIQDVQNTTRR